MTADSSPEIRSDVEESLSSVYLSRVPTSPIIAPNYVVGRWVPVLSILSKLRTAYHDKGATVIAEVKKRGVGVIARTVLESGFLTGQYEPGHTFTGIDQRARYAPENPEFISLAQLAIKFLPEAGGGICTMIIGAQEQWHIEANVKTVDPPPTDSQTLEYLTTNHGEIAERANYRNDGETPIAK